MKLVDEYLDKLYKKDNNKSTLELRQEMRDHLIESVNDFKLQGLNEEESCKKAIERFDDGTEMQQELHSIIKELSLSLDTHKSIIKGTRRILCFLSIITFLASGLMWCYNESLQKNRNDLGKSFDEEIRKLAEKYDMTKVDEYKLELESLLNEDKYSKIKAFRLHVADMEDGNTSLSSSGVNAKTVYDKEVDYSNTPMYTEYLGYNGKDFLDKSGNIINPDVFSEYFFYLESKTLIQVSFVLGVFSLISYFILKLKISLI
ncbi:MAG: permease prefix domain 1-containing protein [Bacilli bacterium]